MKDLVILCADKDMEFGLRGLLSRPASVGIRSISFDIFVETEHDPACARRGVAFLRMYSLQYQNALLLFDLSGSGRDTSNRVELQRELNEGLAQSGWEQRAATIVIDPELEAWVWSDSPHVDRVVGWTDNQASLREWLREQRWLPDGESKPPNPKEAFEAALRKCGTPRSASLYQELGKSVGVSRCTDAAYHELLTHLRAWFPAE
ncbi:MAG: hypothetical protein RBU27_13360 [Bacteroidota bacterium]|jgi:hypothetical protein|nr:hypothetical protein [Bacteroidota bacterium]